MSKSDPLHDFPMNSPSHNTYVTEACQDAPPSKTQYAEALWVVSQTDNERQGKPMNKETEIDVIADYWRAYFEWRAAYGLSDDCVKELLGAIRVEITSPTITQDQVDHLRALERMIEVDLEDDRQTRRAA
jgi:hypothetical protein